MKIAVTATGPSLDAEVDPRFGRCPYFLFVETEDLRFEAVQNSSVTLGGGAGIQSAQLVAEKGAQCVLTGNCGPNAYRALEASGIQVVIGCCGTARQAVESYQSGARPPVKQPNVASHFGMGRGRVSAVPASPSPAAGDSDLTALKREAKSLGQHLRQVEERIRTLEQEEDTDAHV